MENQKHDEFELELEAAFGNIEVSTEEKGFIPNPNICTIDPSLTAEDIMLKIREIIADVNDVARKNKPSMSRDMYCHTWIAICIEYNRYMKDVFGRDYISELPNYEE